LRVRFLADANLDQDIVAGVLRREPDVDFELPQGIIPEGMTDPDVLAVAASLGPPSLKLNCDRTPIWVREMAQAFYASPNWIGMVGTDLFDPEFRGRSVAFGHTRL
jgi:hypothetical protein